MNPLDYIVAHLAAGRPVMLQPHREPKVWGVGGVGEYWYGVGEDRKTAQAVAGDAAEPLRAVLERSAEAVLGPGVLARFGTFLPLVKILTPRSRLSVQFHDAKNEIWIVTGTHRETAGEAPWVIVGFHPEMVDRHGKGITGAYGRALGAYGRALNELIDAIEGSGERGRTLLRDVADVGAAAERLCTDVPGLAARAEALSACRGALELYYDYREVSVGDVVPIPSGTLHALGPGVEVVEPQIPGPTQSLEDGATYPVRYAFPGYDRPGAQKRLDIDRVGEMNEGVTPEITPDILLERNGCRVERLPGRFEDKGLEVNRLTLEAGATYRVPAVSSAHILVAVGGSGTAVVGEASASIPQARAGDDMLLVPACAESLQIEAIEALQVIDTFTPVKT